MQNEVIELGMLDGWMLGAEKENGRLLESRLFLVTELLPTNLPEFTARIAQVNQLSSVGRGYVFQAFEEPCLGCEVMVQPGWELSSLAMRNDFLKRFVKALDQELIGNANADG